jgi:hypothetical protein
MLLATLHATRLLATETTMKQALLWGLTLSAAFAVTGCPVFPDHNNACMSSSDCAPGYSCDLESGFCQLSPTGGNGTCSAPTDCGINETCGRDSQCHIGSCRIETTGCVDGYSCQISGGVWTCIADGGSSVGSGGTVGAAGAPGTAGATSGSGGTSGDAGVSLGGAAGATSGTGGSSLGGAAGATGTGGASAAGAPAAAGQAGAG